MQLLRHDTHCIVVAAGGYDGLNILNSVERYDPHTGHWTSVTPMANKRSGTHMDILFFKVCTCMCVDIYIHNKYAHCMHMYYVNKNFYFVHH